LVLQMGRRGKMPRQDGLPGALSSAIRFRNDI